MSIRDEYHEMMKIDALVPYHNHPFKPYTGKRLDDMVSSVRENGIIHPILARNIKESYPNYKYEILSGHNRVNAAKIAGLIEVPVIINTKLTDDEARIIVTETNLMQRSFEDLSHSERAICLSQHYAELKCQGKRNDLISEIEEILNSGTRVHTEHKKSRDKIGGEYKLSATNVSRYIRLSRLIPPLLELVDSGDIAFLAAYQISFIEDETIQKRIAEYLCGDGKISVNKASYLRKLYADGTMTAKNVREFLYEDSSPNRSVTLCNEIVDRFFAPQLSKHEVLKSVVLALQFYSDNMAGGDTDAN